MKIKFVHVNGCLTKNLLCTFRNTRGLRFKADFSGIGAPSRGQINPPYLYSQDNTFKSHPYFYRGKMTGESIKRLGP